MVGTSPKASSLKLHLRVPFASVLVEPLQTRCKRVEGSRLKYYINTTPVCRQSLGILVGPHHTYGSGARRRGPQTHKRLPPVRVQGPVNATLAQRLACLRDEPWDSAGLQAEWTRVIDSRPSTVQRSPADRHAEAPVSPPQVLREPVVCSLKPGPARLVVFDDAGASPSPFWPGLLLHPSFGPCRDAGTP